MRIPRSLALAGLAALALLLAPAAARAAFGFLPGTAGFDVAMTRASGSAHQAGSHPDRLQIHLGFNSVADYTDGDLREAQLDLPAGLLVNPAATEECSMAQFSTPRQSPYEESASGESCPDGSQVGVVAIHFGKGGASVRHFGLFNLAAPYGAAEAIGFSPYGVPIVFAAQLRDSGSDPGLRFTLANLSQELDVAAIDLTLWGAPWDLSHDVQRGNCLNELNPAAYHGQPSSATPSFTAGTCYLTLSAQHTNVPRVDAYLTLPTVCGETMRWAARARSWQQPGLAEASAISEEGGKAVLIDDCLEVLTKAKMQLRTDRAATATGIVFSLDVNDGGGFLNFDGHVRSPIRKAQALLPEGLTLNPSLAAGLGVCTEAEFARESAASAPGAGCPASAKIGEVSATGLLGLAEPLRGSVFLAKPYENPSGSLIALYITLASPRRGLFFKSSGRVEPDLANGRLRVSFEDLPPIHYDLFSLSLREGERAALVSPPVCGTHLAALESSPWSDPGLILQADSTFTIKSGEGGGACPTGGRASFHPALQAGSLNPNAGAYTPFKLRMTRTDAEQEITSYSATFPPGLLGKLAGIPYCPDAAIEAAKHRSALAELESPSCPAASEIGHTLAGYGVGSTLAYAAGGLYLAGPYHGAPFSILAVDSALVGPFDLGVVLVRSAIRIDPRTAQVSIDSAGSDPIPHIIKGIPIHLRDIRVDVDRPGFTVNPTSCDPLATSSTLSGSGASFFDSADDVLATASNRYQLSNCSAYGLKPRLSMKLTGGTKRGRYPALKATYAPRPGDANLKQAAVSLPSSIFLAQEHIREICTMVRFRAKTCPRGSRLGSARAVTPLLDEPLQGPVYVRSSANPLPDIVASLSGRGVEIEVVGRIDKARHGGLRGSFETLPDAPLTRFTMTLSGGKRGLLVNADDLCASPQLATARLVAHNNASAALRPKIAVDCRKGKQRKHGPRR